MEIINAPRSSSYTTWWKLSNPQHTLSKCLRGKGWKLIMCSPQRTLHLQHEGDTHITVSCFSVLSSARFYALKTDILRKLFGQNTLLCSPAPSPAPWGTQSLSKFPNSTVTQANLWPHQHSASQAQQLLSSSWQFLFCSTLAKRNLLMLGLLPQPSSMLVKTS